MATSIRVMATCGTLCIELGSVKLFLLPRSFVASTLVTGSYQVGSEELIEIVYVFVFETCVRMREFFSKDL